MTRRWLLTVKNPDGSRDPWEPTDFPDPPPEDDPWLPIGPALGQVREPVDECQLCTAPLTSTCRICPECIEAMDRHHMDRHHPKDSGPA